jgi:hypothetical protein
MIYIVKEFINNNPVFLIPLFFTGFLLSEFGYYLFGKTKLAKYLSGDQQ